MDWVDSDLIHTREGIKTLYHQSTRFGVFEEDIAEGDVGGGEPPLPGGGGGGGESPLLYKTTPEPSVILGFITLGGFMLGSRKKEKA